ncbi:carbohydrate kinase family protein [Sediminibacterium soli]|uniref:carbohydrate kinase family protein n=1 Tax=Sediminibacterium soli TaxID=2698829 RepID=UPI001379B8FC|nr:carbohydrate kinase family protein [Sediminibacterium soli]NCI47255.1 hypothetical protein [Sediminibacterium soli]
MKKKPTCFGAGLVALDVILNGSPLTLPKLSAGGSCGNVMSILGFLGWDSYPVARLAANQASTELIHDLDRWHVHKDHLSVSDKGSTPIIIHRILKDKNGNPVHRFEFRDPETKSWLPQFKPITKDVASEVMEKHLIPEVFYFDRMNPGTFELATYLKARGTIIFFEPSSAKDVQLFEKFKAVADIIKYSHDRIPDYRERYPSIECLLEIETQGKNGLNFRSANSSNPDKWKLLKAFVLAEVKDAAGAGDWCSSGIIQQLCLKGHSEFLRTGVTRIESGLRYGQALGALNCLYDGARGLMYHYTARDLQKVVDQLITEKSTHNLSLKTKPLIDISSGVLFSSLYK